MRLITKSVELWTFREGCRRSRLILRRTFTGGPLTSSLVQISDPKGIGHTVSHALSSKPGSHQLFSKIFVKAVRYLVVSSVVAMVPTYTSRIHTRKRRSKEID